jgi:hypothetical protein
MLHGHEVRPQLPAHPEGKALFQLQGTCFRRHGNALSLRALLLPTLGLLFGRERGFHDPCVDALAVPDLEAALAGESAPVLSVPKRTHASLAVRDRLPASVWRDYTTIAVDPNPWDKVVSGWSWWQHRFGPINLDDYLDLIEERVADPRLPAGYGIFPFNLRSYSDPASGEVMVDRLLRYEHLDRELDATLSPLGVPFRSR